jgi:tetratricopeptide (TPR) repeat protein
MNLQRPPRPTSTAPGARSAWLWVITGGCLVVILLGLLLPRSRKPPASMQDSGGVGPRAAVGAAPVLRTSRRAGSRGASASAPSPEETVAAKVSRFAHSRLAIARAMAEQARIQLPPDVEQFFAAAEAGRWEELKGSFDALKQRRQSGGNGEEQWAMWPAIMETYGVAEVAHLWPAQKLLDYGEAVLGSLRPGMVYVGGTDDGRFIPTLLNETGDGERHVVLTQNALADGTYLNYLGFLYNDRMTVLTTEDAQQVFKNYIADAQKRLAHDQEFPQEPKQIRPGEDVRVTDGRVQVSGQVAVMAINEKLLETLMNKNPGISFALQESFPFKSTYPDATPLGPVMELRAQDAATTFTADTAARTLDYWRSTSQQLLTSPEGAGDAEVLKAYSKLATAQAGLLASHEFNAEAEETYQLATQICPSAPEAVFGYANLLLTQRRFAEALPVLETAVRAAPDNQQFRDLLSRVKTFSNGK